MVFIKNAIPTIGIGQQPTIKAAHQIHKPSDTVAALNLQVVAEMVEILREILFNISERPRFLEDLQEAKSVS